MRAGGRGPARSGAGRRRGACTRVRAARGVGGRGKEGRGAGWSSGQSRDRCQKRGGGAGGARSAATRRPARHRRPPVLRRRRPARRSARGSAAPRPAAAAAAAAGGGLAGVVGDAGALGGLDPRGGLVLRQLALLHVARAHELRRRGIGQDGASDCVMVGVRKRRGRERGWSSTGGGRLPRRTCGR